MSVYKSRYDKWTYDFWFQERRYYPAASMDTREDAQEAEALHKRTLRRRAVGLDALAPEDTPRFSDWAAVTFKFQKDRKKVKNPKSAKNTLRMILAFWGTKPRTKPVKDGTYLDLRLGDPIQDPALLSEFEDWMTARKLSGARKNHYRSACSMLYRVAMLPENRTRAGVRENPFVGVLRDRVQRHTRVLTPEEIQRWIAVAPPAVAVAVAIGTLLPGLRLRNIVDLEWKHFSAGREFVTVAHKADRETGLPLTIAVSVELRTFLEAVHARRPADRFVVPIDPERPPLRKTPTKPGDRSQAYWTLGKLLKRSIKAAGLPYGKRIHDGVTFHALRHSMNTFMARQRVPPPQRARSMGHATDAMQRWYTHMAAMDTVEVMELLGKLPLAKQAVARLKTLESPGTVPAIKHIRRDSRSQRVARK